MLTIATHNLHQGGPTDYSAWAHDLTALAPDILLLQESSPTERYRETLPPELRPMLDGAHWAPVNTRWGSAIAVRHGALTPLPLPEALRGWVVGAEVAGLPWRPGAQPLRVFSLHVATRDDGDYIGEANRVIDAIAPLCAGYDVVLGGDFNLTVGERQPGEPLQTMDEERAVLRRLQRELGLIGCWQATNPNRPLPRTLQQGFQPDSPPHHIDGIFVPAAWYPRLERCAVLDGAGWERRSDHRPVVATFTR